MIHDTGDRSLASFALIFKSIPSRLIKYHILMSSESIYHTAIRWHEQSSTIRYSIRNDMLTYTRKLRRISSIDRFLHFNHRERGTHNIAILLQVISNLFIACMHSLYSFSV